MSSVKNILKNLKAGQFITLIFTNDDNIDGYFQYFYKDEKDNEEKVLIVQKSNSTLKLNCKLSWIKKIIINEQADKII